MNTMTMPKRSDWTLPLAAVITLILAGVGHYFDQRLPPVVWEGRDLVEGLDPKAITRLTVKGSGSEFTINKEGEEFMMTGAANAPANPERISELLLRLSGAQIAQTLGAKTDWETYKVADSNAESVLEIYAGDTTPRWKIFLGKYITGQSGRAVRLSGKDEVFVTKEALYFSGTQKDYQLQAVSLFDKSRVQSTDVIVASNKLPETKFKKDELLSVLNKPGVEKFFRTGLNSSELSQLDWKYQVQMSMENGITKSILLAKYQDKWYARAQAHYEPAGGNGIGIDISKLAIKGEADRFNQKNMTWIWELNSSSGEQLQKALNL